jgi:hypothetical protein
VNVEGMAYFPLLLPEASRADVSEDIFEPHLHSTFRS